MHNTWIIDYAWLNQNVSNKIMLPFLTRKNVKIFKIFSEHPQIINHLKSILVDILNMFFVVLAAALDHKQLGDYRKESNSLY